MPVTRSEEYYFPRDNLVIQVEDTLFRLHSGILELHSGFFRDMFATPSKDSNEGTSDDQPLRLPTELCSAESFTTLCKIICPKVAGVFPSVRAQDFEKWEPVLNATDALQMTGVQNYILTRFQDNLADLKTEPVKVLNWATRSGPGLTTLKFECFCVLVYRRQPLSEFEMSILGYGLSAKVIHMRERIRLLFSNPTFVESLRSHIPIHASCDRGTTCQNVIFEKFVYNLSKDDTTRGSKRNNCDIFQLSPEEVPEACPLSSSKCRSQSNLDKISSLLRGMKLDAEIQRYMIQQLLSTPTGCFVECMLV